MSEKTTTTGHRGESGEGAAPSAPAAPTGSGSDNPAADAGTPPAAHEPAQGQAATPPEIGGRKGPDPTRYGDWEIKGRCIDF